MEISTGHVQIRTCVHHSTCPVETSTGLNLFFPYYSVYCKVMEVKEKRREDKKLCVKEERNGCFPRNIKRLCTTVV